MDGSDHKAPIFKYEYECTVGYRRYLFTVLDSIVRLKYSWA